MNSIGNMCLSSFEVFYMLRTRWRVLGVRADRDEAARSPKQASEVQQNLANFERTSAHAQKGILHDLAFQHCQEYVCATPAVD